MEKKIKIAVLGCGDRSRKVIGHLLEDSERRAEIAAIYDPDASEMKFVKETWESPDTVECTDFKAAVDYPGVQWVMVFSPNAFHHDQILYAFGAGKNVFSEKPIGTTLDDCVDIYNAYKASGKRVSCSATLPCTARRKNCWTAANSGASFRSTVTRT